jgi:hypothetical protein
MTRRNKGINLTAALAEMDAEQRAVNHLAPLPHQVAAPYSVSKEPRTRVRVMNAHVQP